MKRCLYCSFLITAICSLAMIYPAGGQESDRPLATPQDTQRETTPLMPADKVAAQMQLPDGFRVSVFAAEPDIRQPIAMTTDSRGRLWVVENYTYAQGKVNFATDLRDRIVILEDEDQDGVFDRRKVFWDEGLRATSVELGFGGVWVTAAPQLLFIPDRNHDDVPDGPPEVLLDGWDDDRVRHNIVNGLKWGPDGWLYGRHGIQATSHVGWPGASPNQRTLINCGIWRYHPVTRRFDVVAHGTTNPWGMDWDEHGELFFINTVIGHLWHAVPGAHFRRMYGEHFDQHVYNVMPQTADHFHWDTNENWNDIRKLGITNTTDAAGGGHAHSGLLIYQGGTWPKQYHGKLFTLNLHGRRVNQERLLRSGSAFVARHDADFLKTSDPWFRGIDFALGRDGNVYLADWSDIGECHENDGVHRSSGRIYKISYGEPARTSGDLNRLSDLVLVLLQSHANVWYSRMARQILHERHQQKGVAADAIRLCRDRYLTSEDIPHKLRFLWTLHCLGAAEPDWLAEQLRDENEHIRSWALRLLVDAGSLDEQSVAAIVDLAQRESSGLVKLYLASALQELPEAASWSVAEQLTRDGEFASDRFLPLMIWYGISAQVPGNPRRAIQLLRDTPMSQIRECIARRIGHQLHDNPAATDQLLDAFLQCQQRAVRTDILKGLSLALAGQHRAPMPRNWQDVQRAAAGHAKLNELVQSLGIVFGDGNAVDALQALVKNNNAPFSARRAALRSLASTGSADFASFFHSLMRHRELGVDAIHGLASLNNDRTAERIVAELGDMTVAQRAEAINTLASSPAFAGRLLDAVENQTVDRGDVQAFQIRQMRGFDAPSIRERLDDLWPPSATTTEDQEKLISHLLTSLSAETLEQANPSQGRLTFTKTCSQCHRLFGQGGRIGPELTGAQRHNLTYLVENIVSPSASLAQSFRMSVIELEQGRVINGVVLSRSPRTITVQTPDEKMILATDDIADISESQLSLMPENLLGNLSRQDIADLFAYLMSPSQVPLPDQKE